MGVAAVVKWVVVWVALVWVAYAKCPQRCLCDDRLLRVDCNEASLDTIPITLHPGLRELRLSGNGIKGIRSSFNVYTRIELLDVSFNQLHALGSDNFVGLTLLRSLNLSNNMIDELDSGSFHGLRLLEELSLRHNRLRELIARAFYDLKSLRYLDLSHNQVIHVDSLAFVGLAQLSMLSLGKNELLGVPADALVHLPNLDDLLDLSGNSIQQIDDSAFEKNSKLAQLQLDQCSLQDLDSGAFNGLTSLKHLFIRDNNFVNLPSDALSVLAQLEQLDVSGNPIVDLRETSFQSLTALKRIYLTRLDNLYSIDDRIFDSCNQLEEIYLENNRNFHSLHRDLFASIRKMKRLSLRGNSLKYLHPSTIPVDQLEWIDLSKNPWECNCSIAWLLNDIRFDESRTDGRIMGGKHADLPATRCAAPVHLQHVPIHTLSLQELDCEGPSKRSLIALAAASGLTLIIFVAGLTFWYRRRIHYLLKRKELETGSSGDVRISYPTTGTLNGTINGHWMDYTNGTMPPCAYHQHAPVVVQEPVYMAPPGDYYPTLKSTRHLSYM